VSANRDKEEVDGPPMPTAADTLSEKELESVEVNAIKEKQLTNNRSSGEGVKESLTSASKLSLEQSLDFIEDDELLEVTPISLRIRKRFLTEADRRVAKRSALK
jgi:predicted membrane GTPase involved in stress response